MMICMQPEVLAGLIGFGGAVVGAGGALLGGWFQQRHQAALTREDRQVARAGLVEERGRAAADGALAELHALRRHVMRREQGVAPDEELEWLRTVEEHVDQAAMASGLIPEADEMRTRVRDALDVVYTSALAERRKARRSSFASRSAVEHVIEVLSAYKRGDDLPGPTHEEEHRRIERESYDLENPPDAP